MCDPVCGICGKAVTWNFNICEECQQEYGRYASDREDWANMLVNDERMRRYYHQKRIERISEINIDDLEVSYSVDMEMLVDLHIDYAGYQFEDTDGNLFEYQDSDWEAVYTYGV